MAWAGSVQLGRGTDGHPDLEDLPGVEVEEKHDAGVVAGVIRWVGFSSIRWNWPGTNANSPLAGMVKSSTLTIFELSESTTVW
ncbi:hypothetical protein TU94_00105 [Streptomyces cyaneogriseus subsp. noncyanogenus]|uniref:Uncharacterized protein n=1 Tax=Streptomyces cyaneogriseus subsp. noncyanogenus TaxID=477245 RepID=A0A0C5G848_9ACTN|nr:hypothetical protein TU94_00105 [Streptomyces cyaneogriseus subsp. noncyanogenus]